jgi:excisionase family DNA binding protein
MEKMLFTVGECAEILGLGATSIWRAIRTNELKAVRVGRAVRVARQNLEAFCELKAAETGDGGFARNPRVEVAGSRPSRKRQAPVREPSVTR